MSEVSADAVEHLVDALL